MSLYPSVKSLTLRPFLFSSDLELQQNQNLWFAMWINPKTLQIAFKPKETQTYTKKGYGILHWKNEPPVVSFTGISGWLFGAQEINAKTTLSRIKEVFDPDKPDFQSLTDPDLAAAFTKGNTYNQFAEGISKVGETLQTSSVNDPRLYVNRLKRVALQQKFYYNTESGTYDYNKRYLTIHSKRYPDGLELQGHFESFNIKETAEDAQLVPYSARMRITAGFEDQEGPEFQNSLMQKFYGEKNSG
jgi:hypothetical protein